MENSASKDLQKKRIAIIGAGAVGSVIGGLLFNKGYDVTLVGRRNHVEEINKNGLLIDGIRGEYKIKIKAKERLDFRPDIAFLTMKTQDLKSACEEIKQFIKDIPVLTFQNGVSADKIAAGYFNEKNIISCIVMFNSKYIHLGKVSIGREGYILIGRLDNGVTDELIQIRQLLSDAVRTEIISDISGARWSKLFINLFSNSLSVLSGMSSKDCINNALLRKIGILILKEAFNVIAYAGITLGSEALKYKKLFDLPLLLSSQIVKFTMNRIIKQHTYPSTLQSILRHKTTEIDYLNGEIVKLAKELNISAPINTKVVDLVKEVEKNGNFCTLDNLKRIFLTDKR